MKTIQRLGPGYRFSVLEVPVTDHGGCESITGGNVIKVTVGKQPCQTGELGRAVPTAVAV